MKKYLPHILLCIYIIEAIVAGIGPYSRSVWYAENIPIMLLVGFVVFLYYRGVRFSNTAYILMFILPFWHTIGGHYTFERVPFDFFNNLFGFERNMFDRIGHFTVGFYALPIIEYLVDRKLVTTRMLAITHAIYFIAFVAVFYEWTEWWYAELYGGSSGAAFLGSQGDIWDAQKDMLLDVLGAIVISIFYMIFKNKDENSQLVIDQSNQ